MQQPAISVVSNRLYAWPQAEPTSLLNASVTIGRLSPQRPVIRHGSNSVASRASQSPQIGRPSNNIPKDEKQ